VRDGILPRHNSSVATRDAGVGSAVRRRFKPAGGMVMPDSSPRWHEARQRWA